MKQILFIQGGGDDGYAADQLLVDSLKTSLGSEYSISYPQIATRETESDYGWPVQIGQHLKEFKDSLILVGHSFGASMILKYLAENAGQQKIEGVFLISTPFWSGSEDWVQGIKLRSDFADRLPPAIPIVFYHAKDDEEVPISHFHAYRKRLSHAVFRQIESGGHQLNNDLSIVANDILAS